MTSPSKSWVALMCPVCGSDFQQQASSQNVCSRESCKRAWIDAPVHYKRAWRWAVTKMVGMKRGELSGTTSGT